MRQQPCPMCEKPITFSWADFLFLSNWGKAPLFCWGCKKGCTIDTSTTAIAFVLSFGSLILLYLFIFHSGLISLREDAKSIFILLAIPVSMILRAVFTERFAKLQETDGAA